MMPARLFLPVVVVFATTLHGQQAHSSAVIEPTIAGVVRDGAGSPISDVEVGIVRGERLQQFIITTADGKFLLTGIVPGVVPLRIRRLGYAMQFLDVDTRLPSAAALEIRLKTVPNELEDVTIPAGEADAFELRAIPRPTGDPPSGSDEFQRLVPNRPGYPHSHCLHGWWKHHPHSRLPADGLGRRTKSTGRRARRRHSAI